MASRIEALQQQIETLKRERDQLAERAARAEETNASMADVVGYYILRPGEHDWMWDGTLHPTLSAASRSFWDKRTREVVPADGWDIFECRRIVTSDAGLLKAGEQ